MYNLLFLLFLLLLFVFVTVFALFFVIVIVLVLLLLPEVPAHFGGSASSSSRDEKISARVTFLS